MDEIITSAVRLAPIELWVTLRIFLTTFLFAALLGFHNSSFADPVYSFGPQSTWTLLSGVSGGGSFTAEQAGGYIAGELSLSRLNSGFWMGAYVDGGYEFTLESPLITTGPEIGWGIFGLDGGVALRFVDGAEIGAAVRLLITAGVVSLYGRFFYFPVDEKIELFQIGAMLKFPLWASR